VAVASAGRGRYAAGARLAGAHRKPPTLPSNLLEQDCRPDQSIAAGCPTRQQAVADITKARMLIALAQKELWVCQIIEKHKVGGECMNVG